MTKSKVEKKINVYEKKYIFSAYPGSPVSYGQEILREERITLQCKGDF